MTLHAVYTAGHWNALTPEQQCALDEAQQVTGGSFRNLCTNNGDSVGPSVCLVRQDKDGETFLYFEWRDGAWSHLPDLTWHWRASDGRVKRMGTGAET